MACPSDAGLAATLSDFFHAAGLSTFCMVVQPRVSRQLLGQTWC
jgi:hypothetical protein